MQKMHCPPPSPSPLRHYLLKPILRRLRLLSRASPHPQISHLFLTLLLILSTLFIFHLFQSSPSVHPPVSTPRSLLQQELHLLPTLCAHRIFAPNVTLLRTCNIIPASPRGKVVALIELRNPGHALLPFLNALTSIVHSVVALDDHSSDATRIHLLQSPIVELVLNRTHPQWLRHELQDRQLLLKAARLVGATHFLLLDYDEFISYNCQSDLRQRILQLPPAHSLFIPWVHPWKSPFVQRVLPHDPQMNFLTRRQTVIFADHPSLAYTRQNSLAHLLSNNATIHVLRCPRSVCPLPLPYRGPHSPVHHFPSTVHVLSKCRILDMRFLSLHNALLKSAWYEALGRVLHVKDGLTTGKMVSRVFAEVAQPRSRLNHPATLAPVQTNWLPPDPLPRFAPYVLVETWRANQLFQWIHTNGMSLFRNLPALSTINFEQLRVALQSAAVFPRTSLKFVPQHKSFLLVYAIENPAFPVLSTFLQAASFLPVPPASLNHTFPNHHLNLRHPQDARYLIDQREALNIKINSLLNLLSTTSDRFFIPLANLSQPAQFLLLEHAAKELSITQPVFVFANWPPSQHETPLFSKARTYAAEAGNSLRVIDMPLRMFGSFSALRWLRERVHHFASNHFLHALSDHKLLLMAEHNHMRYSSPRKDLPNAQLAPVARLIFSLNVGRSGSKYLAEIIATVANPVSSLHEPRCLNNECSGGGAMRMQRKMLNESYEKRNSIKIPMISKSISSMYLNSGVRMPTTRSVDCSLVNRERRLFNASAQNLQRSGLAIEIGNHNGCVLHYVEHAVYAETNPNFKSWFYDVVLDHFPRSGYQVTVLVVRKYLSAVLRSLYRTGYFTSRDGYNWMETSASVNSRVRLQDMQDDSTLDGFEKLVSYVANAEAVFQHVSKKYSRDLSMTSSSHQNVQFVEVKSEEFYSDSGTLALMEKLGLRATERTAAIAGKVRDKRKDAERVLEGPKISLHECKNRVDKFIRRLSAESRTRLTELLGKWNRDAEYIYEEG